MIAARRYIIVFLILICPSAFCQNLVTLAYDDGVAEDGLWMGDPRGHAVLFTAPCENWTLSQISVYGKLVFDDSSGIFVAEIWDDNLNLIAKVTDKSGSFFGEDLDWALVDVPDVKVSRNFSVTFYEFGEVYVGTDLSSPSGRSLIAARNPNQIQEWNVAAYEQSQTDWMIRAHGHSPPPTISLDSSPLLVELEGSATMDLDAYDPDANLKRSTIYVLNNETGEVIWSEIATLEGDNATVHLSWPLEIYQISSDDQSLMPALASNSIDPSENVSQYMAFSAPCAIQLEQNDSLIQALAYFGMDGKFNALIDNSGYIHYVSQEVLKVARPDLDYMSYMASNITLIKDKTRIGFYRMNISETKGPSLEFHQPILLSKSPLFNYKIELETIKADLGDYLLMVVVEDEAQNAVAGRRIVNVKPT